MIISHKHKFIFLKSKKTAGTSIEIYLSRFCGEDDVITPISPRDEAQRRQFGIKPQNYTEPWNSREFYWEIRQSLRDRRLPAIKKVTFSQHASASLVKEKVGRQIWESYFKFCFVRNPWDRVISRYYWDRAVERKNVVNLLDESLHLSDPAENLKYYLIDEELALDYVGKFETLADDLEIICNKINIPFTDDIPRTKTNVRKDKRHYSQILTPQQASYIESRCRQEIDLFGYKYQDCALDNSNSGIPV